MNNFDWKNKKLWILVLILIVLLLKIFGILTNDEIENFINLLVKLLNTTFN